MGKHQFIVLVFDIVLFTFIFAFTSFVWATNIPPAASHYRVLGKNTVQGSLLLCSDSLLRFTDVGDNSDLEPKQAGRLESGKIPEDRECHRRGTLAFFTVKARRATGTCKIKAWRRGCSVGRVEVSKSA